MALLLFSVPAVSEEDSSSDADATGLTDADCQGEWADSVADDTCQNESVTAEGEMCRVVAACKTPALVLVPPPVNIQTNDNKNSGTDRYNNNNSLVNLDDVADLVNCGGVLTVGSC